MLKCPVCNFSYKEEVNTCKKCHLSDDNIEQINTINPDNPIFKVCIPTLLKRLDKQIKQNQESKTLSHINQLESKIQLIARERNENKQRIEELEKKLIILEYQLQNKDSHQNIASNIQNAIDNGNESVIPTEDIQHNADNGIINQHEDSNFNNLIDPLNNYYSPEKHHNNLPVESDCSDNNSTPFSNQTENYSSPEIEQQAALEAIKSNAPHFIEEYNSDKTLFNTRATSIVIETQESMENRLGGRGEAVYLSDNNKGKYWIIEEENNYYLVPHAKININEHNKHTIENLFEFDESDPDYNDFKLIQPAKVLKTNSELWQLEQKGKLEFC